MVEVVDKLRQHFPKAEAEIAQHFQLLLGSACLKGRQWGQPLTLDTICLFQLGETHVCKYLCKCVNGKLPLTPLLLALPLRVLLALAGWQKKEKGWQHDAQRWRHVDSKLYGRYISQTVRYKIHTLACEPHYKNLTPKQSTRGSQNSLGSNTSNTLLRNTNNPRDMLPPLAPSCST